MEAVAVVPQQFMSRRAVTARLRTGSGGDDGEEALQIRACAVEEGGAPDPPLRCRGRRPALDMCHRRRGRRCDGEGTGGQQFATDEGERGRATGETEREIEERGQLGE
nr:unnamed protein product [Digitaria exilis]